MTTYDYDEVNRITVTIRPGGATEIHEKYRDGWTRSIAGSGVVPRYYEYGVNADGSQWTKVFTGRPDSSMWEKSTTDLLGRTLRTEKPGFTGVETTIQEYDPQGRLQRTATSGQADTLYEYDALGSVVRTGLDLNHNNLLEASSRDRINESTTSYLLLNNDWWQASAQRVFAKADTGTSTPVAIQRTRLTGFGVNGQTQETVSIDVNGNQTSSRSYIDRVARKQTRVTDYPDATIAEVLVSESNLLVSARSKTGVEMTYNYDSLGRQISIIDPRTGTTISHYNTKGEKDYIDDPAMNWIRFAYPKFNNLNNIVS